MMNNVWLSWDIKLKQNWAIALIQYLIYVLFFIIVLLKINNSFYSLDCREGHMKKNEFVCVCLSGQRSKKHQWSTDVFAIQLSSNQVSRGWEFNQSGFEGLGIQPIRFWGAGSSANQVSRELGVQPIRFWGAGSSANQVSRGWSSANQVLRTGSSANQVISLSGSRPIRFFWNRKIRQWDGRTVIYNSRKVAVLLSSPQSMACGKGISPWGIILKNGSG